MQQLYLIYPDEGLDLHPYTSARPEVFIEEFKLSYNTSYYSLLDCFFISALRETLESSAMISQLSDKEIIRIEHRLTKVRETSGQLADKVIELKHKKKITCFDEDEFKMNCKKVAENFVYQFKIGDLREEEFINLLKEYDTEEMYRFYVEPTLTQLHRYVMAQKRYPEQPVLIFAEQDKEKEWGESLWIRL